MPPVVVPARVWKVEESIFWRRRAENDARSLFDTTSVGGMGDVGVGMGAHVYVCGCGHGCGCLWEWVRVCVRGVHNDTVHTPVPIFVSFVDLRTHKSSGWVYRMVLH